MNNYLQYPQKIQTKIQIECKQKIDFNLTTIKITLFRLPKDTGLPMKKESKAFGIITRNLFDLEPYYTFLKNAAENGHIVDHLIIAYEGEINQSVLAKLQAKCQITLIKRGDSPILNSFLFELGLTKEEVYSILGTPFNKKYKMIAYGTSRNYVLIAALMLGINYLMFFDTDVYPKILSQFHNGKFDFINIDFVGSHLKYLKEKDVCLTTSDYTGYYIIPQINFPNFKKLLYGVQKEGMFDAVSTNNIPVSKKNHSQNIVETLKAIGGNMALDLSRIDILPPFFSTALVLDDECFLGRGEDTLFGPEVHGAGRCMNIDLFVFHNCFGDFPKKPVITIQKNLDRFFYACMGWVIRNPFLNWIREKYSITFEDFDKEKRYEALLIGSKAAAEYFNDNRFLKLPRAYKSSYEKLGDDIKHYEELMLVWKKLRQLINKE